MIQGRRTRYNVKSIAWNTSTFFSVLQHILHAQLVGWILYVLSSDVTRLCGVMESEPVETGAHGDFPVCVQQIRPLTPAVRSVATHIRHLALTRPLPPSSLALSHTRTSRSALKPASLGPKQKWLASVPGDWCLAGLLTGLCVWLLYYLRCLLTNAATNHWICLPRF